MEQSISLLLSLSLLFIFLFYILKKIILPQNPPKKSNLPPSPPSASPLPILAHIFLHRLSILELSPIIRRFHILHGPIFSLRLSPFSNPTIFISSPFLAHSSLILKGANFADRPPSIYEPNLLLTANNHNISSSCGSLWRLLRRNLSSETLHQSRIRVFSSGRCCALQNLVDSLRSRSGVLVFKESLHHAISFLLVLMCFGEKLGGREIRDIESPMVFLLRIYTSFNIFAVFPAVTKVLFRKRWEKIVNSRRRQAEIFLPMIRARQDRKFSGGGGFEFCYVDSLLCLKIPQEGGRGLTDDEMVVLCHEFLSGGIDTTTTALEWTMAELAKNQRVQAKLWEEISSLIDSDKKDILKEEDLMKMSYLKAVVMESLRRHPPGHFLLPHFVTEDVTVGGFLIPEKTEVNFGVADVNWDTRNWTEPLEFRPERFMEGGDGEGVDISGSKEIKMMTFGAGRRICPGYGLAMLHLEFFVANLVKEFEWKVEEGAEVDLSEKLEFTTVMKNPLRARLHPRGKI